ncbi:MAG TPA: hypothetical protein PLD23_13115 [Armatimonadota bacterium]|nr:hypothetical protein [Armatimonadota bacterium]
MTGDTRQTADGGRSAPVSGVWHILLVGVFLASIVALPVSQVAIECARGEAVRELRVFARFPTAESLAEYERGLERDSYVGAAVRRAVQRRLFGALHAGNEKCVVGRDGALFYRPSIDSVVAPGFMAGPQAEGHPVRAITAFRDALSTQGVELLLVAVPGKESVHPEWLAPGYPAEGPPPANVDLPAFMQALGEHGVRCIDPTGALWAAKAHGPMYLRRDTHWSPAGLNVVADLVAQAVPPELRGESRFDIERLTIGHGGDLHDMLDIGRPPVVETVRIDRVIDESTGEPVEPDALSPVVLLGDSFTNIYSVPDLGWGDHAGLAEQLALRIGRRIDVIALNDGGVNTSRASLCRRPHPLEGKRLVIWQFAARDLVLANGNWKTMRIRR